MISADFSTTFRDLLSKSMTIQSRKHLCFRLRPIPPDEITLLTISTNKECFIGESLSIMVSQVIFNSQSGQSYDLFLCVDSDLPKKEDWTQ